MLIETQTAGHSLPQTWTDDVDWDDLNNHIPYNRTIGAPGYLAINFSTKDRDKDTVSKRVHSTITCSFIGKQTNLRRVPTFYEEDGTRKAIWKMHESVVTDCDGCPERAPYETGEWRAQAQCRDAAMPAWGDDYAIFMDVYCEGCPVALDCLEFGAEEDMGGMVYGGVYLSQSRPQRNVAVNIRRQELALG